MKNLSRAKRHSNQIIKKWSGAKKKIIAKLNKNNNLEVRFLSFLVKKFQAGGSYHLGSSFQMKKNNDLFSTDMFGRPYNFKKISVVDSSILPSLPSNSHTFLTMANCY